MGRTTEQNREAGFKASVTKGKVVEVEAARKACETKGPEGRSAAAVKAAATRAGR